eukprot:gnl/MRDRNA2_/MRDRNA2_51884_c0_seq1.p1 gnl/MRDRNA2_/MRDRNA2_51884_c0~~gnl/MRDRNA2_/MRDRNA2_51884_c0_seq1.p1  ORF type:complete len:135 (+),score=24.99 gnl/MRDRNA2_/MRDRNA2_51884_c0_seq1:182-586(+)
MNRSTIGPIYRRVEFDDDADGFRSKVFQQALALCETANGTGMFRARAGEAYFWRNYLSNGEDDVRAIHGGCSPKEGLKPLLTLFIRDKEGPFEEEREFWDVPRTLRHQLELLQLTGFRLRHHGDLERLKHMVSM